MGERRRFPVALVSIVLLGWIGIGFPRMLISSVLPIVEAEFNASHAQAALLMSSFLLPSERGATETCKRRV